MKFIILGLNKILSLGLSMGVGYIAFKQYTLRFVVRRKIEKGDLIKYLPKLNFSEQSQPNNYTILKFTSLSGKLNFNLITKETKFIDFSLMTEFNEKEYKQRTELEKQSHTFKYLVYHNKKSHSIKMVNFEENLNNTNKELMQNYQLNFTEKDIIQITTYLTKANKDFLIYNGYTDFYNINFHIYSKPRLFGGSDSRLTPFFGQNMIANITLVSKKWNTHLYLGNDVMWFTNKFFPVKVYYIVKNKLSNLTPNVETKGRNSESCNKTVDSLIEPPYIMYVDNLSSSGNAIFETDIIKILRKNPYIKLYYRKVSSDIVKDWLNNEELVEIFTLGNDNTVHSVYQVNEVDSIDRIVKEKSHSHKENYSEVSEEESSGVGSSSHRREVKIQSTFFKDQLLSILKQVFEEKIIMSDVYVTEYKYI